MKFTLNNTTGQLSEANKDTSLLDNALDKVNEFSDVVISKEIEFIIKPLLDGIIWTAVNAWQWFVQNLPDIMGYSAFLTAICIIICSALGRGGIIKPLALYAFSLIISVCILGS